MMKKNNGNARFPSMTAWVLLLLMGLTLCSSDFLTAKVDISGYFENRFFLVNNGDIKWDNLKEKFKLSDYNRVRLKYSASPSEKITVKLALDLFSFHGLMTSPLGTYETDATTNPEDPANKNSVKIDLDRAYVDLYFKHFDVTIGKQRVAMGVSYIWSPLDVFNRVNILEPKEEKPGANAVKVYVPLGDSSAITGVFSPEDDFASSKSGLRAQTHLWGVDAAVTLIRWGRKDTSIYGIDLRGENLVGWWLEAGYFVSPLKKNKKIAVGFDYTFPLNKGLYWRNEFFYDSSGQKDPLLYDYSQVFTADRFTLGQTYLFSMLQYPFSDFLSASVSYVGNLKDGSYLLNPTVQYEIMQNVDVFTGFYLPLGKKGGEFNRQNTSIFFVWLKVTF